MLVGNLEDVLVPQSADAAIASPTYSLGVDETEYSMVQLSGSDNNVSLG